MLKKLHPKKSHKFNARNLEKMQLKPEYDLALETGFSMSGMPDQQLGYNSNGGDDLNQDDVGGLEDLRFSSYLYEESKAANSMKRSSEDDSMPSESNKRLKTNPDFTAGFQQGAMSQYSQGGMDSNLFQNVDLQRAAFAQQQMDFNTMNRNMNSATGGGLGSASLGLMERRMEQETNRQQQQQSAMLANEMALRSQMGNVNQSPFGNMDNSPAFGGSSQRQQLFGDSNSDIFGANSLNSVPDLQNLQGLSQLSSMSAQPFLSNMLDISLLNNRMGFTGGFNGGTLPPMTGSTSLNQPFNQQMNMAMSSSQGNNSNMGGGFSSNSMGGTDTMNSFRAPAADPMSSISPLEMLRLTQLNAGGVSLQQQQQQAIVPQQQPSSRMGADMNFQASPQQPNRLLQLDTCQPVLPPFEEANTPHFSQRPYAPFSVDEDSNWLSEFQCFIRSEILELFRVSQQGIKVRNALKSLTVGQVGIRCRFCAHLQHGTRANRASCFPSKIDKIYQSFTMMLREHFPSCSEIPPALKKKFRDLQDMNAQGASNAKGFWEHAAKKKGLIDLSEENGRGGIHIFDSTLAQAALIPPFGAESNFQEPQPPVTLIQPSDKGLVSNFLYALMEQVYRVHLAPSERKGNRKSLRPGMPGFGCRYCYEAGRMGLCRLFPARRRTIHTKIPDLFDHMKRCPLCPQQVKENLVRLNIEDNGGLAQSTDDTAARGRDREFFERIWARLGHQEDSD